MAFDLGPTPTSCCCSHCHTRTLRRQTNRAAATLTAVTAAAAAAAAAACRADLCCRLPAAAAPAFTAQAVVDGDFKSVSLADYKGRWTILFFYPLDWT